MYSLIMDMITGNGYLLIPGFFALPLVLVGYINPARPVKIKADCCRLSTRGRYYRIEAVLQPVIK